MSQIKTVCLSVCVPVCNKSIAVLTGPSESPPKWSMYVMVSPGALMAPTLVTASAMMAEARTSAAWAAASRRMCRKRHNFRFLSELRLQRALYCRAFKLYIAPPRRRARAAGLAIFRHIPYPVPRTRGGRVYACSSQRCLFYLQLLYSRPLMRSGITYTTVHKTVLLFAYAPRAPTASHQTWAGTLAVLSQIGHVALRGESSLRRVLRWQCFAPSCCSSHGLCSFSMVRWWVQLRRLRLVRRQQTNLRRAHWALRGSHRTRSTNPLTSSALLVSMGASCNLA